MRTRIPRGVALAAVLAVPGCASPGDSPPAPAPVPVVATIDGVAVPESAFEDYLKVHFVEEGLEEPVPQEDTDRVRSRLFDDFIDESVLVLEAERRGVPVDDDEVTAWLGVVGDADPAREAARRAQARREIATQKLLDAWIRAESRTTDAATPAEHAAERLIANLRGRSKIEIHHDALPFRYVPEAPPSPAPH